MNRDKEVCLVSVGNVRTGVQGNEDIGLTGIYHLDIGTVLLHQFTEGQSHIQVNGLLFGDFAYSTCIMAAMTSVNDQRKPLIGSIDGHCHEHHYYK